MAVNSLMLDTSAYALFKHGHRGAILEIRKARSIIIPAIVLGELLAGIEYGTRKRQNEDELDEFLKNPRTQIAPIGSSTAERYAQIYAYLRKNGRPIPTNDLWIAASAMEHSSHLMTADSHFQDIPQILIVNLI